MTFLSHANSKNAVHVKNFIHTSVNRTAVWTLPMSGAQYWILLYQYQIIFFMEISGAFIFVFHCEHGTCSVKIGVLLHMLWNSTLRCCSGCHGNLSKARIFHGNCLIFESLNQILILIGYHSYYSNLNSHPSSWKLYFYTKVTTANHSNTLGKHPNIESVSVPCAPLQMSCVYTSKENQNFLMLYYKDLN